MIEKTKQTALITGASSGLGEVFTRKLAAMGYNVIMVARSFEKMQKTAQELKQRHGVTADVIKADLSIDEDVQKVSQRIKQEKNLYILVNNAGFGTRGFFPYADLDKQFDMLNVHVKATMALCHAALPEMIERKTGRIINVSSLGAFMSSPESATYYATKAFLNTFSESLQDGLQGTDVKIQALCPGLTHTGFHSTGDFKDFDKSKTPAFVWMDAEDVVDASLKSMDGSKVTVIPGLVNKFVAALMGNGVTRWLMKKIIASKKRPKG